jgi:membrane fusion protein, multidrug efflux system
LGNVVSPTDALGVASITQTQPMAMVFSLPAAHVLHLTTRLRENRVMAVQAWDPGSKKLLTEGRVAAVDNAIDPATDTIKVKVLFPNTQDVLFPNQTVGVTLQLDALTGVLALPQAAVLRGAQGFYVYLVNTDYSVTAKPIQPGAVEDGWMAVQGPLQESDRVVIDGSDRLREGAKVQVVDPDAAQRVGSKP